MVRLMLAMVIFGWAALVAAAPAIVTSQDNASSVSSNEDNSLDEYSLPNFSELSSDIDVNQTVEQVEKILKANPSLPRLSKGEILYLLNNITTEDKIKHQQESQEGDESNRSDDRRSLMVVLPFKAGDNVNKNVSELYTKTPIIRYITPKPAVAKDKDLENDFGDSYDENSKIESNFTNHKYTDEETTKRNQNLVQNDFWQNQAQKVMNDLKTQNDKTLKHKEVENKSMKDVPFKKMPPFKIPQEMNYKNTSDNIDANSEPSNQQISSMVLPSEKINEPMDSLVPEHVRDLLASIGIFNGQVPEFYPIKIREDSQVKPMKDAENIIQPSLLYSPPLEPFSSFPDTSAYVSFKPLPLDNEQGDKKNSDSLDDILQRFGLMGPGNTDYVPISVVKESETGKPDDFIENTDFVESDMFPADMTSMLTEMGLTNKKARKMSSEEIKSTKKEITNSNILKDDDTNEYVLGTGPDPMSLEEMELMKDDAISDMVKRQMFNESTIEPDAELVVTGSKSGTKDSERISGDSETQSSNENSNDSESQSSSDNSATKEDVTDDVSKETVSSESPNLADLEDSFGASPADEDPSEAVLPPPRKNGFYYMLDWNSFLEVGEGDTKVNIRFNPKLGDPQRFLPVTVP